jgi:hypothetical protein
LHCLEEGAQRPFGRIFPAKRTNAEIRTLANRFSSNLEKMQPALVAELINAADRFRKAFPA